MNNIFYIIGVVVVVLFIAGYFGLRITPAPLIMILSSSFRRRTPTFRSTEMVSRFWGHAMDKSFLRLRKFLATV